MRLKIIAEHKGEDEKMIKRGTEIKSGTTTFSVIKFDEIKTGVISRKYDMGIEVIEQGRRVGILWVELHIDNPHLIYHRVHFDQHEYNAFFTLTLGENGWSHNSLNRVVASCEARGLDSNGLISLQGVLEKVVAVQIALDNFRKVILNNIIDEIRAENFGEEDS